MQTKTWIWEQPNWPSFQWNEALVQPLLRSLLYKQGLLLGKSGAISREFNLEVAIDNLLQNIITSSAIEGEKLNLESVRSSLAKRLGLAAKQPYPTSDRSEGLVKIMMDAITNLDNPLNLERLFQWHQWLFPNTEFSLNHIQIGQLRSNETMQVVSGRIDKPKVHFEAPPRSVLEKELNDFINWFNQSRKDLTLDLLIRAAICHLWFVTIHPFDDGNGRLTRALTDLSLAQADKQSIRLYTMSATILEKREDYYRILEFTQRSGMDITAWILWFLQTLDTSLETALEKIERTVKKTQFWQKYQKVILSAEHKKVLNRLLDGGEKGFEQGISASQYQKVAKVSKATATRHLTELLAQGLLVKLPGGGRNTRYKIHINE